MDDLLFGFATAILASIAASLVRVLWGPTRFDRVLGAQLLGTGGVAVLLITAAAGGNWAVLDVALVLALLAAFASFALFVSVARPENHSGDRTWRRVHERFSDIHHRISDSWPIFFHRRHDRIVTLS